MCASGGGPASSVIAGKLIAPRGAASMEMPAWSSGKALKASLISRRRMRTASETRTSDRSLAASASGWRLSPPGCRPAAGDPGTSQGHQVTFSASADSGLEIARWHQVDPGTDDSLHLSLHPPQAKQSHARGQVSEQVYVAVGAVLATCDAAEYPQVGHIVGRGSRHAAGWDAGHVIGIAAGPPTAERAPDAEHRRAGPSGFDGPARRFVVRLCWGVLLFRGCGR